jgi:hypothetical protein
MRDESTRGEENIKLVVSLAEVPVQIPRSLILSTTIMRSFLLVAALVTVPFVAAQKVSTSARCGPSFGGLTCKGSTFGSCCSRYSYW